MCPEAVAIEVNAVLSALHIVAANLSARQWRKAMRTAVAENADFPSLPRKITTV
jgi:hypothetical protein